MKSADKQFEQGFHKRFAKKQTKFDYQKGVIVSETVDGQPGFVNVDISGNIVPVLCKGVPPTLGMNVWVGYKPEEPSKFQVIDSAGSYPTGVGGDIGSGFGGYAPATYYEWLVGPDPLNVHLRAITFLKIGMSPSGGMNAQLYAGQIYDGTDYIGIDKQDLDLTSYIPATADKAAMVLVTINTSGTAVLTDGSDVDLSTLTTRAAVLAALPSIPSNTAFVCGAIRVFEGQVALHENKTINDFLDLRFQDNANFDYTNYPDLISALAAIGSGANPFEIDGVLAVTTNAVNEWLITGNTTVSGWYIYCRTTGSASDTIVDVNKNGMTIFTTQANRPTLAYNDANKWAVSGTPDFTTFVAGDVLSIDIDQVATGAADLVVVPIITQTAAGLTVKDVSTTVPNVTEITAVGGVVSTTGAGLATITVTPEAHTIVQIVNTEITSASTVSSLITLDDTIPQNTEGTEIMTRAITPTSATNLLYFDVSVSVSPDTANWIIMSLYQDSTADALRTSMNFVTTSTAGTTARLIHRMVAGTTSSTTFKIRVGEVVAGTLTINGNSSARLFGGALVSSITITEVTV